MHTLSSKNLRQVAILALSLLVAVGTLAVSSPADSQGPGGPGECCTMWCGMEPPCGGEVTFNCSDFGMTGTWPDCSWPQPPVDPTCADSGQLGTYPNCYPPPSCADSGQLGTYPNCYPPATPSCEDFGQVGVWPACSAPPADPTCADFGMLGAWPSCYPPATPTCADSGMLGTWPICYPPATPDCSDYGQLGTYPDCYDPPTGPSASLTANPTTVSSGGSSTLTWSSSNATSCTGGGFSTGNATSGSRSVSPASTQTYTLQCSGPGGSDTDDATVTVSGGACGSNGLITATATPARVQPGGDVVLSWSATNVDGASCTVTNLSTGSVIDTGTVSACTLGNETTPVNDLAAQTTFRITCGALTKDVTVNIIPRYEEF